MITIIARVLLALQLLAGAGFYLLLTHAWGMTAALAAGMSIALVLALRALITSNSFVASSMFSGPSAHALDWRARLRLFRGEFFATMLSSSWSMPFCAFHKRPASDPRGPPVLLIHGYGCNSGYWHPLSKVLSAAQVTHHAISLEPVFGDIDAYVPFVRAAVETLCKETGRQRIVIVAHSMGGLVARAYLRDCGNAHVAKVVTLGTPHRGTGLANFGIGENSRQMRWRRGGDGGVVSDWLQQLEGTEDKSVHADFVSIYSHHDNIVSPQTSSCLAGATHIELRGIGHVALAVDKRVQAIVLEEVLNADVDGRRLSASR